MAVDTRDKRFSMFSLARQIVPTMPNPDGSFAVQGDRQQLAWMYRGILAGLPAITTYPMLFCAVPWNKAHVAAGRNYGHAAPTEDNKAHVAAEGQQ